MKNFISSYDCDKKLALYDIEASIAHARMLAKCKIVSPSESKKIIQGLTSIYNDIRDGKTIPPAEDIHYAIEKELIRRVGACGGKLHTARSRNDQVVTDLKLYLKDEIKNILSCLKTLRKTIAKKAAQSLGVIMPGYTHLQQAQPILFSHYLMAYCAMFERDVKRFISCYENLDELPLGAAALAGTSFPIDRNLTAKLLGFSKVSRNSIDSVSDRDFIVEFLAGASILMSHISHLAEDFIIWSCVEFDFIKIADEFTSGSSIMPQKKNQDYLEIMRAKTGVVFGSLVSILTILKGLPLGYNRDLQECKAPLFECVDTTKDVLKTLTKIISSLKVNRTKIVSAFKNDYLCATEIADYLARKKLPFRTAHTITNAIVKYAMDNKKNLSELELSEYKNFSKLFEKDIYDCLDFKKVVNSKNSFGGTSTKNVKNQIQKVLKSR